MGILDGVILIYNHCYKAEEMAMMIDVAKEFNYHVGTFHHDVEAYKIANLMAEIQNCSVMWPDWWGFKMEGFGMVQENFAMVDAGRSGDKLGCAIVHSGSASTIQRLTQEAGKILIRAKDASYELDEADSIRWITLNADRSWALLIKRVAWKPKKMPT